MLMAPANLYPLPSIGGCVIVYDRGDIEKSELAADGDRAEHPPSIEP
jgi:hypothetical protein